MFINDQWLWKEMSDIFIEWIEDTEVTLDFIPEYDLYV